MEGTLREIRKKFSLSQDQLADRTGISQVVISNLESGKNCPRAETRKKIEKELGEIDWLGTRKLPEKLNRKVTVMEAENQLYKAIELINSLDDEQKFSFMVIAERFLSRYINTEIFRKKLKDIKNGTPAEEVFTDEEIIYWSQEASNELLKRRLELQKANKFKDGQ